LTNEGLNEDLNRHQAGKFYPFLIYTIKRIVEGFVNRYVCHVTDPKIVCVTEYIDSGPGMRARLALGIEYPYSFVEVFELGGAGKKLAVCFANRGTRRPALR
jgi:hypothetical protein